MATLNAQIEEAAVAILVAHAGVSGLVATRVSPEEREQNGTLPAITFLVVSHVPEYTVEGHAGFCTTRLQFDCWATSYSGSRRLAEQVRRALDSYFGAVVGIDVQNVSHDQDVTVPEREQTDKTQRRIRHVASDFSFQYDQPKPQEL